MRHPLLLAAASIALTTVPATAQSTTSTRDRIGQILGNLLGVGNSANSSLDGQWRAGRYPLGNQRTEFDAHVVVIGGGFSGSFDRFGPALQSAIGAVPVRPASLGPAGPLLGAAQLAFRT